MPITLPDLPYAAGALEPYMSMTTVQLHHDKHHKGYVDKTNGLIEGTALESEELEEIIRKSAKNGDQAALFNNAAQVWNHTFFWNSMTPGGGGMPEGQVAAAIERDFGGFDRFRKSFAEAATGRFGSGWAWLVFNGSRLEVTSTPNAEMPIVSGLRPLLTCDVWEHAYYLDYQNERAKFVAAFLDNLVNWKFVAAQLAQAQGETELSTA